MNVLNLIITMSMTPLIGTGTITVCVHDNMAPRFHFQSF